MAVLLPLFTAAQETALDKYIETGIANNPGLNATYKEYEMALREIRGSASLPDPQLSAGIFVSPVETRTGPQRARFSLSQMFPWFGSLKLRKKITSLLASSRYEDYMEARNRLVYQIKKRWFELYLNQKEIGITEKMIHTLNILEQIAVIKYETGETGMADILRIQMEQQDKQARLETLRDDSTQLTAAFNLLLNRDTDISLHTPDTLEYAIEGQDFHHRTNNNPQLKARRLDLQLSTEKTRLAKKRAFPDIGLGLDYVIIGKRPDADPAGNGNDAIMPMLSIKLPVFQKKYTSGIKKSELNENRAQLRINATTNNLRSEYERFLSKYKRSRRDLDLYSAQYHKADQVMQLLLSEYSATGKKYNEVMEIQQVLYRYALKLEKALTGYHSAIAYFEYISGNPDIEPIKSQHHENH